MMQSSDAELQPRQKIVVSDFPTIFHDDFLATQPSERDGRGQARFNSGNFSFELRDKPFRAGFVVRNHRIIIEHEFDKLALCQERREPGQRQYKVAFIHRAQALKQLPAFLVYRSRQRIGKIRVATVGVIGSWTANSINMHHPTATQARKSLVDTKRHHFSLFIGAA